MWNIIFTKFTTFVKLKLKEKTLLKGVTPSLLLYYVLGNHTFEKTNQPYEAQGERQNLSWAIILFAYIITYNCCSAQNNSQKV